MRKAVFLDRDGTIIVDTGYLSDPQAVALMPGAAEVLRDYQLHGYDLVVVSNQSGIARGLISLEQFEAVQRAMLNQLQAQGVSVRASYFCPHAPEDGCSCRKPRPGLLLQAAGQHDIELTQSLMIGDKLSDIAAGKAAGCRTILVSRHPKDVGCSNPVPDEEYFGWAELAGRE